MSSKHTHPEPLDRSILDEVKSGTLPTQDNKIDIFASLSSLVPVTTTNPLLADLKLHSDAVWEKLQVGVVGSTNDEDMVAEFHSQIARAEEFDQYIDMAGKFLHLQSSETPANKFLESDTWSEEKMCSEVRKDWLKYYDLQKQKHGEYRDKLKSRYKYAKLRNNEREMVELNAEKGQFFTDIVKKFRRKLERQMVRKYLMVPIKEGIEEVEESYYLFLALRLEEETPGCSTLQLIEDHERAQEKLVDDIDDLLLTLSHNVDFVEAFRTGPSGTSKLSKKALTRMRRICAMDVEEGEEREWAAKQRFLSKGHGYFRAFDEIEEVKIDEGICMAIWEKVEDLMVELEMKVLKSDALECAQMALVRVMGAAGKSDS
jgi:hypothetical protein